MIRYRIPLENGEYQETLAKQEYEALQTFRNAGYNCQIEDMQWYKPYGHNQGWMFVQPIKGDRW